MTNEQLKIFLEMLADQAADMRVVIENKIPSEQLEQRKIFLGPVLLAIQYCPILIY